MFDSFVQNIDCGFRGGSNEYPQSMFWIKIKENRHTPANLSFTIIYYKIRVQGDILFMDMLS